MRIDGSAIFGRPNASPSSTTLSSYGDLSYMELHYEEFGSGAPLVLVHGLFGSNTNWRGVAKLLSDRFHVITVDLPNHGRSPHGGTMTYADMSTSLRETLGNVEDPPMVWVGHSMGGKAVMDLALTYPELVDRLVVVDVAPVRYPHSHTRFIDAMIDLDIGSLRSRADADRILSSSIVDTPTRLFLLQNLVRENGGFRWRLNLPVLSEYHDDLMDFPDHSGRRFDGPVLFVTGGQSDYVTAAHRKAVLQKFPGAGFETIHGAGHWVHADKPGVTCEAIARFLKENS